MKSSSNRLLISAILLFISIYMFSLPANATLHERSAHVYAVQNAQTEKYFDGLLVCSYQDNKNVQSLGLFNNSNKRICTVFSSKSEVFMFLVYGDLAWERQILDNMRTSGSLSNDPLAIQTNTWQFENLFYQLELYKAPADTDIAIISMVVIKGSSAIAQYWIPVTRKDINTLAKAVSENI